MQGTVILTYPITFQTCLCCSPIDVAVNGNDSSIVKATLRCPIFNFLSGYHVAVAVSCPSVWTVLFYFFPYFLFLFFFKGYDKDEDCDLKMQASNGLTVTRLYYKCTVLENSNILLSRNNLMPFQLLFKMHHNYYIKRVKH